MTDNAWGPPIDVRPLLSAERESLIDLLANLGDDDWAKQTPCRGWSVHDLAVRLLHDDLRGYPRNETVTAGRFTERWVHQQQIRQAVG